MFISYRDVVWSEVDVYGNVFVYAVDVCVWVSVVYGTIFVTAWCAENCHYMNWIGDNCIEWMFLLSDYNLIHRRTKKRVRQHESFANVLICTQENSDDEELWWKTIVVSIKKRFICKACVCLPNFSILWFQMKIIR